MNSERRAMNFWIGGTVLAVAVSVLFTVFYKSPDPMQRYAEQVSECIDIPLPSYRRAALISFDYNVGVDVFCRSSVARYINKGAWAKGCDALLLYDRPYGVRIEGLWRRRVDERKLCYNQEEPPAPDIDVLTSGRLAHEGELAYE